MTSTIIIIPAEDQEAANEAALGFDPVGGAQTFTVALSATGELPATHFWCAGPLTPAQASEFQITVLNADVTEWNMETDPGLPEQLLTQRELQRIQGENIL